MTHMKKQIKITKLFKRGGIHLPEDCDELQEEIQQLEQNLKEKHDEFFQLQRQSHKQRHTDGYNSKVSLGNKKSEPFIRPGVIALICGLLVVILMVLGLASADWLMAAGWRQGLFMHCIDPGAPMPLPFDITAQPGCYAARPAPYIKAAAGLCVATLAADVCGALLTGLGLRSADHRTKFRYYRFAVLAMALALMCILIALVIYPVCFAAELNLGNRSVWELGWAYGVGWGAAIFLFGAVVLLLCDKESEELYYKERKVVSAEPGGRPLGQRPPARPGAVSAHRLAARPPRHARPEPCGSSTPGTTPTHATFAPAN